MTRMKPLLLLGIVALCAAALFSGLTAPGRDRIAFARQQAADLASEAAALELRIAELETAQDGATLSADLFLPGEDAAGAALGLQQTLVDLAAAHGIVLSSFGDAPAPADLSNPAVSVLLEGDGRFQDVTGFLQALENHTPRIALSQLLLRGAPRSLGEAGTQERLVLRLAAWGFYEKRPE